MYQGWKALLQIHATCAEAVVYNELLSLDDKNILDVGFGDGKHSRTITAGGKGRTVLTLEVNKVQHRKNLEITGAINLTFALGSAEAIPAGNDIFDVVFLFKSLHHVHVEYMGKVMQEIHRVLKPGGFAYISEPFHDRGDFMEMVLLFNKEQKVHDLAFEAICDAAKQGLFKSTEEVFLKSPREYTSFQDFVDKHMNVSYRENRVPSDIRTAVKRQFESHSSHNGLHFVVHIRVDLLQKNNSF